MKSRLHFHFFLVMLAGVLVPEDSIADLIAEWDGNIASSSSAHFHDANEIGVFWGFGVGPVSSECPVQVGICFAPPTNEMGIIDFDSSTTGFDELISLLLDNQDDWLSTHILRIAFDGTFFGGGGTINPESQIFGGSLLSEQGVESIDLIRLVVLKNELTVTYEVPEGNVRNSAVWVWQLFDLVNKSVVIDIKPSRKPNNIIDLTKERMIKVAILTDGDFDALQVDPSTVIFGPAEAAPRRYRVRDIDGDGDADLLLIFKTSATGIECGDTHASLIGETFSGEAIAGIDSIETANCD